MSVVFLSLWKFGLAIAIIKLGSRWIRLIIAAFSNVE